MKFRKVKEDDGTMNDIIEDEVLFERIDEYPMIVATASVALNQAIIPNISLFTEKITQAESAKKKLQDKITSLKIGMKKRKKVDDHFIPLK